VVFIDYQDKDKLKAGGEPEAGTDMESKSDTWRKRWSRWAYLCAPLKCLKPSAWTTYSSWWERRANTSCSTRRTFGKKSLEEIISKLYEFDPGPGPESSPGRCASDKRKMEEGQPIDIMRR